MSVPLPLPLSPLIRHYQQFSVYYSFGRKGNSIRTHPSFLSFDFLDKLWKGTEKETIVLMARLSVVQSETLEKNGVFWIPSFPLNTESRLGHLKITSSWYISETTLYDIKTDFYDRAKKVTSFPEMGEGTWEEDLVDVGLDCRGCLDC